MFALATAVPEAGSGSASGLVNTTQELGAAAGLAVLTAIGIGIAGTEPAPTFVAAAAAALLAAATAVAARPTPEPVEAA